PARRFGNLSDLRGWPESAIVPFKKTLTWKLPSVRHRSSNGLSSQFVPTNVRSQASSHDRSKATLRSMKIGMPVEVCNKSPVRAEAMIGLRKSYDRKADKQSRNE